MPWICSGPARSTEGTPSTRRPEPQCLLGFCNPHDLRSRSDRSQRAGIEDAAGAPSCEARSSDLALWVAGLVSLRLPFSLCFKRPGFMETNLFYASVDRPHPQLVPNSVASSHRGRLAHRRAPASQPSPKKNTKALRNPWQRTLSYDINKDSVLIYGTLMLMLPLLYKPDFMAQGLYGRVGTLQVSCPREVLPRPPGLGGQAWHGAALMGFRV